MGSICAPQFLREEELAVANLDAKEGKIIRQRSYNRDVFSVFMEISATFDEATLSTALNEKVNVDLSRMVQVMSLKTEVRDFGITAEKMARTWNCELTSARRMFEQTTQMAVRDFKDATMTRRLKASNYQLSFRHLKVDLFTDTMFSKVKSCKEMLAQKSMLRRMVGFECFR
jgi:hypothetical protein